MEKRDVHTSGEHKLHHLHLSPKNAKLSKENTHQHGPLTSAHDLTDTHGRSHLEAAPFHTGGTTLDKLNVGGVCVLRSIGGDGALRRRLLDMGLTPGTRVTLRSKAPMGDPLELQLRGYSLSLRKEDAALITADICETPARGTPETQAPAGVKRGD